MDGHWLDMLHVLDSGFPIGAYVHSLGLESLGLVDHSADQIQRALADRVAQALGPCDMVFVVHAHAGDLMSLDQQLNAMLFLREVREASALLGTHLLNSAADIVDDDRLRAFRSNGLFRHHPVAFGGLAAALGIEPLLAAEAYGFGALRGLVSAAQRLGWLGQRDGQRILHALKPIVRSAARQAMGVTDSAEAAAFSPAWDIASMVHERATARMFAS